MMITLVAAMAKNRAIGKDNRLLWHLPADMQRFKRITMGKPVMMGRKTFESIGHPLPGRTNIVLTRSQTLAIPGCVLVTDIEQGVAVAQASDAQELMVIGGASFYEQMIRAANKIELTLVDVELDGDAYFPEINGKEWDEINRVSHKADMQHAYNYDFVTYIRK